MDLTYPADAEEFRADVRAWLEENLPEGWFDEGFEQTPEERKAFNRDWTVKLKEGRWDWLGVHPKGQFVLGSPRRTQGVSIPTPTVVAEASTGHAHGYWIDSPDSGAGGQFYDDPDAARAAFADAVRALQEQEGHPAVLRLRLIIDFELAEEEYVVHRPPTYT